MLIKEYRILLPLTVDEYRIAQLYMIQKKSRLDSSGTGSGVEIITNEPYINGPGGSGQYTYKIYHIAWIKSVLPSNALEAHEEAWNAYPFTKTRYTCPLMDRFLVEVETRYMNDAGNKENVFDLNDDQLKNRQIDVMDFVKDSVSHHDYCIEEDPKIYKSEKTNRGPLTENWVQEHQRNGQPIMCAYKICRVEFRYWGLQTRAERWIHDLALRSTMLRAHRQAWAWQDEWINLTMTDIRLLEEDAARFLSKMMSSSNLTKLEEKKLMKTSKNNDSIRQSSSNIYADKNNSAESEGEEIFSMLKTNKNNTNKNYDDTDSDDIFFDCYDKWSLIAANEKDKNVKSKPSLIRWSSELLLNVGDDEESAFNLTPKPNPNSSLLILVFHGDIFPENPPDTKTTDIHALTSTLEYVVKNHYPQLKGRVQVLQVTCGKPLASSFNQIKAVSSYFNAFHPSFSLLLMSDQQKFNKAVQETIKQANKVLYNFLQSEAGSTFIDAEIFAVSDCVGGLLMYEALSKVSDSKTNKQLKCHQPVARNFSSVSAQCSFSSKVKNASTCSLINYDIKKDLPVKQFLNQRKSIGDEHLLTNLNSNLEVLTQKTSQLVVDDINDSSLLFKPNTAFLLGCPLALVLMQKKLQGKELHKLECEQLFNLYYPLDLCAGRLEPVLNTQLTNLSPVNVPRYQRSDKVNVNSNNNRRKIFFDNILETPMLWGNRRVDHQLYCPSNMVSLPISALPNILHASYWESKDVSEFILRQFVRTTTYDFPFNLCLNNEEKTFFKDYDISTKSWNKKRTRFKIANLNANHRGNDVIVVEGLGQNIIHARFCYGPMDLVALSFENILVYTCPYRGKWSLNSKEVTDTHGRVSVLLNQVLPIGIHSIRMIVEGDRSFLNLYVAVVPPKTECVVFSIDGSLTGSVSVTGRDPKVKPGAVDVVRFWQQMDYLIIYVTARPDMQQRLVAHWLAQHNFPHGLLFFTPSFSTDPLKQKTQLLRHLTEQGLKIAAAYGSAKDVHVYSSVGIKPTNIYKVCGNLTSKKRSTSCIILDSGYANHLYSIHSGEIEIARASSYTFFNNSPNRLRGEKEENDVIPLSAKSFNSFVPSRFFVHRTDSFTPQSGKHTRLNSSTKKGSQTSILTR